MSECGCLCIFFFCLFVLFYSLLKAPPFPKYFYFIHQKPIFPFFVFFLHSLAYTFSWFYSVWLREVNPTDETDPFILCCGLSYSLKLLLLLKMLSLPGGNKPFNWLIFCLLSWFWQIHRFVRRLMCRNYSKKGSLKNWLKNFDTCESCLFADCRPNIKVNKRPKNCPKNVMISSAVGQKTPAQHFFVCFVLIPHQHTDYSHFLSLHHKTLLTWEQHCSLSFLAIFRSFLALFILRDCENVAVLRFFLHCSHSFSRSISHTLARLGWFSSFLI